MVGKFGKFFLLGIFLGYSKQSEDLLLHSSANKIQPIANLGSQIRRGIFLGNCYSIFATDYWKSCLALSPGALLWISSDGDDPKIFLVGKFGKFFLLGIFLGYSKQSEDLLLHSSANKIQPIANLGSQIRRGIFLGVDIWYRDFFGF